MSKRLKLLFAAFAVATVIISVILFYPLNNGNDDHENNDNGNDEHENDDNEADFLFSFEDDMQGWEARAIDLELGNSTIDWSILRTQERALNGSYALKFYLENWNDMGKIWIERRFVVEPKTVYGVNVSYAFASADWGAANFFRIIAGVLQERPTTRDQLTYQGDTGNGHPNTDVGYVWLNKSYNFTIQSGLEGELYVIIGVWGVWETPRTYYLDNLEVTLNELHS